MGYYRWWTPEPVFEKLSTFAQPEPLYNGQILKVTCRNSCDNGAFLSCNQYDWVMVRIAMSASKGLPGLLQHSTTLWHAHEQFYILTLNSLYCCNVRIASCGRVAFISETYPGHARQRKKSSEHGKICEVTSYFKPIEKHFLTLLWAFQQGSTFFLQWKGLYICGDKKTITMFPHESDLLGYHGSFP